MRNKRPLVLLLLACCLAQPALGQTTFGSFDCAQWLNQKTEYRKTWLTGFMTGLSAFTYRQKNWLGPKKDWLDKLNSTEQIFLFTDNYCRANPLSDIESAGLALYEVLMKK